MFDLVTAVETHFWWPNLPVDMREVFRVMKPGGTLVLTAESIRERSPWLREGVKINEELFYEQVIPTFGSILIGRSHFLHR